MSVLFKGISNSTGHNFHPIAAMLASIDFTKSTDAVVKLETIETEGPQFSKVFQYYGLDPNIEQPLAKFTQQFHIEGDEIDAIISAKQLRLTVSNPNERVYTVLHDLVTDARLQPYGAPANQQIPALYDWRNATKLMGSENLVGNTFPEALNCGRWPLKPSAEEATNVSSILRPFAQYVLFDNDIIHGPGEPSFKLSAPITVKHTVRNPQLYGGNELENYRVFQLLKVDEKATTIIPTLNKEWASYFFSFNDKLVGIDLYNNLKEYGNDVSARTMLGTYYACAIFDAIKRIRNTIPGINDMNRVQASAKAREVYSSFFSSPTAFEDFFGYIADAISDENIITLTLDEADGLLHNPTCELIYDRVFHSDLLGPKLVMLKSLYLTGKRTDDDGNALDDINKRKTEEIWISTYDGNGIPIFSNRDVSKGSSSALLAIAVAAAFDERVCVDNHENFEVPDLYTKIMCLAGAAQIPDCTNAKGSTSRTLNVDYDFNLERDTNGRVNTNKAELFFTFGLAETSIKYLGINRYSSKYFDVKTYPYKVIFAVANVSSDTYADFWVPIAIHDGVAHIIGSAYSPIIKQDNRFIVAPGDTPCCGKGFDPKKIYSFVCVDEAQLSGDSFYVTPSLMDSPIWIQKKDVQYVVGGNK